MRLIQYQNFKNLQPEISQPILSKNGFVPGGTCYVGVPGDVPFSWVYFLPKNSEVGCQF